MPWLTHESHSLKSEDLLMEERRTGLRSQVWKEFRRNKPALISLYVIAVSAVIALLAPVLANERPLYIKTFGQTFFPAFTFSKTYQIKTPEGLQRVNLRAVNWRLLPKEKVIWAPVPYSPGKGDYNNAPFVSPYAKQKFMDGGNLTDMPSRFRHWLGTGSRGNDLLSGLIHGARISLTIGIISMSIAGLIGIVIGLLAGFLGDDTVSTTRTRMIMTLAGIFFAWFYAFQLRSESLQSGLKGSSGGVLWQFFLSLLLFILITVSFSLLGKWISKIPGLNRKITVPVDSLLSRFTEVVVSLPILLLIIIIAAFSKPSLTNVMIIIGLTSWTGIARLTRAEMLRVREMEYIQAARALGFSSWRIMFRHALPNAVAPALIAVSVGVANAILIESSLSFIGVGVPSTVETWGSLISSAREDFSAWWMVTFPGLCIMVTVLALNLIGEGLRDALDPKLRK
jgi:peptide/nickel transport system permease protein